MPIPLIVALALLAAVTGTVVVGSLVFHHDTGNAQMRADQAP